MGDEVVGESMTLYKEKINYKYPGGGVYVAHQDAPAYPETDYHVTCLLSIDDAPLESGCLEFAKGWKAHDKEFYGLNEKGVLDEKSASELEYISVPTKAGDCVIFSSYIPHRSCKNQTDQSRR